MPENTKILVIRFSAMGDVAMTSPVLKEFIHQNPSIQLLVVSRNMFAPFFHDLNNVNFYNFDPKKAHKGFFGLIRLFLELRRQNITAVADLHNNLRSKILTILFFLTGVKSATLDKGRKEKKELTRQQNKILRPLKLTVQRYADVFIKLRLPFESNEAAELNRDIAETIYFTAVFTSMELAKELGYYESFMGSPA
ncbi:MAG: hypothetical protein EOO88_51045, partial [Pedobacter sp.]